MVRPSSAQVQMSQMRISSVGCLRARPQVPPDLRRVGDHAGLGEHLASSSCPVVPALEDLRQARARQVADDDRPERLEAGVVPLPERRRGRQRQKVRHEVADLAHQVDAQVRDPRSRHGHACRRSPSAAPGSGARRRGCGSGPCRPAPARANAPRGGSRPRSSACRTPRAVSATAGAARAAPPAPRRPSADAGADLDLALQELVGDPGAEPLLAPRHELRRLPLGQRPRSPGRRAGTPPRCRSRNRACGWSSGSPALLAGASRRIPLLSSRRPGTDPAPPARLDAIRAAVSLASRMDFGAGEGVRTLDPNFPRRSSCPEEPAQK